MLKNYLKIAVKNFSNNKTHSIINIFGLGIGMAVFLLIMLYSLNELSYNKFHQQYKSIYQVEIGSEFYTMAPLGTMIKNNIPDSETIVRIDYYLGGGQLPSIVTNSGSNSKKLMKVKDVVFADNTLLNVFNFPVIYGNPTTALNAPYSIVLTRSTAQRLFGRENVVGQSLLYIGDRNSQPSMNMTVTAVVEDVPNNSTISFNAIGSLSTLYAVKPSGKAIDEDWDNWMYSTFIKVKQPDIRSFTNKVNNIWHERETRLGNIHQNINLVPLADVHFHNNNKWQFVFLLQLIGVFILLIAIINFINLTIAKSTTRAKEIGVRKVLGSHRISLIKQFLTESVVTSLMAAIVAVLIVELSKPYFYKMINKQIPQDLFHQPLFILILIASIVIIGIIAGIYPAVILSAFNPITILKNEINRGTKGNTLRHILIVFQFAISIALIICTFLVSKQVDYLKTKDLGFNNKNIIHFNQSEQINNKYDVFKQKLLKNPNVISVSRSNGALGNDLPIGTQNELNGLKKPYRATTVDPDFIPTMKIEMIKGRPFSWNIQSDHYGAIIVNETFVKEFELKQPLGSEINFLNWKTRVIGVMKDFHYNSFHQKVEPAALLYADWNSRINVRIINKNMSQTIQYIKNTWNELSPEIPFEFEFLDQTYDALYKSEEQFESIINTFSIVAVIIACLGLFGLVSHSTDRRTKEIGIRKILGANTNSILYMLTSEFIKWVLLANIIAWPLAWYSMQAWLKDFAYHTEISWWIFFLSGGIALMIALATVSFQAIKAATANPVKSLKYE
jgi:putative ABC transport system permease protein